MAEADLVALKPGASGETLRHIPILNTPTKRQRALYGSVAATLGLSLTLGLAVPDSKLKEPWASISAVIGWTYFWAWSVSFYPQVYLNYIRKSVVGLSYDYHVYNILGHSCYLTFNCLFRWSTAVQATYAEKHDGNTNKVQLNDVMFSLHAVALTLATLAQIAMYDRGSYSVSLLAYVTTIGGFLFIAVYAILVATLPSSDIFSWYTFAYFVSYVKLGMTLVKYLPQLVLNWRRKSTVGWNHWNFTLDFTGGVLSIVQLLMDSGIDGDWSGVTGDPVKFGLGSVSMVYDVLLLGQHYCLYPVSPTSTSSAPSLPAATVELVGEEGRGEDNAPLLPRA